MSLEKTTKTKNIEEICHHLIKIKINLKSKIHLKKEKSQLIFLLVKFH